MIKTLKIIFEVNIARSKGVEKPIVLPDVNAVEKTNDDQCRLVAGIDQLETPGDSLNSHNQRTSR